MIRIERDRLLEITSRCPQLHIGVVGDLMVDRYIWGRATRISPEAPVPIVKVERKNSTLGGAANVLRNIVSLGSRAVAFGVIGDDVSGGELRQLCQRWSINTTGIITDQERGTTVKTRVIADHQQVVRIDDERCNSVSFDIAQALVSKLLANIDENRLDALVVQDYNKGVVSRSLVKQLQSFIESTKIPVALDPHPDNPLELKGMKLFTPNRAEAFSLAGIPYKPTIFPVSDDTELNRVGNLLMKEWSPDVLLITLGSAGMALFEKDTKPLHIPTAAKEVFDVSGAGDTVIATFTMALLAGATPVEAAIIANRAASIVVGKVGTAPVDIETLIESFAR